MLTRHIALVSDTTGVSPAELARVSAALQKQVTRDLWPSWGVAATVDLFLRLEDVPRTHWPILIRVLESAAEAGVYLDDTGQPYALVPLSSTWSLAASRACLELLVNPFGTRLAAGPAGSPGVEPCEYLVEVCAPCGDPAHAYLIDGVLVSDFATPNFFASSESVEPGERYSHRGSLEAAFTPPCGGHLHWFDATSGRWVVRRACAEDRTDTPLEALAHRPLGRQECDCPIHAAAAERARCAWEAQLAELREREQRASGQRAQRLRALLHAAVHVEPAAHDAPVEDRALSDEELSRAVELLDDEELGDKGSEPEASVASTQAVEVAPPGAGPAEPSPLAAASSGTAPTKRRAASSSIAPISNLGALAEEERSRTPLVVWWAVGLAAAALLGALSLRRAGESPAVSRPLALPRSTEAAHADAPAPAPAAQPPAMVAARPPACGNGPATCVPANPAAGEREESSANSSSRVVAPAPGSQSGTHVARRKKPRAPRQSVSEPEALGAAVAQAPAGDSAVPSEVRSGRATASAGAMADLIESRE